MLKPIKPHKESVAGYDKEPTIRIGRRVPEDAVNLAYYYNPTATDAEKVLTADAPRNTIDHRVEEAYRYLFDQASPNDNLFPASVPYVDEEGYNGSLARMYVRWSEEAHVLTKNVTQPKTFLGLRDKLEVPKVQSYEEAEYIGNLFLDAVNYTVSEYKTETIREIIERNIINHELMIPNVTNDRLEHWLKNPNSSLSSPWPKTLTVDKQIITHNGGSYNPTYSFNNYDEFLGTLTFDYVEYEPVRTPPPTPSFETDLGVITLSTSDILTPADAKADLIAALKMEWENNYQSIDSNNVQIANFLGVVENGQYVTEHEGNAAYIALKSQIGKVGEYTLTVDAIDNVLSGDFKATEHTIETATGTMYYYTKTYKISSKRSGSEATNMWNVYANYTGILKKEIIKEKQYPYRYNADAIYKGLARKIWYDYDGMAYYRGSIVKTQGIGNANAELSNELLMYPDNDGYLRTIDHNGNNYYKVEAEQFMITDVFKENTPCYYEHKLKHPIYDYRGPDENGFYEGDAVKVFDANLKTIPKNYKYQLKLEPAEYEEITNVVDGTVVSKQQVKKYYASLYSSFISKTTNTYKATYNAFIEHDAITNVNNGITEDIYNRPFMFVNKDFTIAPINTITRTNKIRLTNPNIIEDSRNYVSFGYKIKATRKTDNKEFISNERFVSILNKEYAVESEYKNFIDRAMIISPKNEDIYMSPFDIILTDQAASGQPTVIASSDNDFVFSTIITTINSSYIGAVNIKCNPDGSGLLTAETTIDTGFLNTETNAYTKKLTINNPYLVENGKIYTGYMVKCLDVRTISVKQPREDGLLESWYPLLQFGHYSRVMDQYGVHKKVVYTMPEYDTQLYSSTYGKPFVDIIEEKVEILNPHMIKVRNNPMYVIKENNLYNITVKKVTEDEEFILTIDNVSFSEGIILIKDAISENDAIFVSYTYLEECYVYRGFWRDIIDFCRIDLNPNQYHTYSDMTKQPSEIAPTTNLFNKTIYFFMRPTIEYEVDEANDDLIGTDELLDKITKQNDTTLYHTIDEYLPESEHDIYLGSVYVRQNTSLHSTVLIDTRTRGGGVQTFIKDSLRKELEPESDFYLDIGYYDGKPYQENGVIVVRLDNSLLKEYGGRFTQQDIEEKVQTWLGFGIYPIIEYVDSYAKQDMPQYNLIVTDSYTNVIDETPEIILDCVSI